MNVDQSRPRYLSLARFALACYATYSRAMIHRVGIFIAFATVSSVSVSVQATYVPSPVCAAPDAVFQHRTLGTGYIDVSKLSWHELVMATSPTLIKLRRTWVVPLALAIPLLGFTSLLLLLTVDTSSAIAASLVLLLWSGCTFAWLRGFVECDDVQITQKRIFGATVIRWDDVADYFYSANKRSGGPSMNMGAYAATDQLGKLAEQHWGKGVSIAYSLRLVARAGSSSVTVTSNYKHVELAVACAIAKIAPRFEPATRTNLADGSVRFSDITMNSTSIAYQNKTIAFTDIEQADLFMAGGVTKFRVILRGKAWPAISVDMRLISRGLTLLSLLRENNVKTIVPSWFMPTASSTIPS
jgi:hypothetical protein